MQPTARASDALRESCPALPPGARPVVDERTQRVTEATQALLGGDGIVHLRRTGTPLDLGAQLSGPADKPGELDLREANAFGPPVIHRRQAA